MSLTLTGNVKVFPLSFKISKGKKTHREESRSFYLGTIHLSFQVDLLCGV